MAMSLCSPFGISTPITRSTPSARTQSAAATELSFPPEMPTIALQSLPFSSNQSRIQTVSLFRTFFASNFIAHFAPFCADYTTGRKKIPLPYLLFSVKKGKIQSKISSAEVGKRSGELHGRNKENHPQDRRFDQRRRRARYECGGRSVVRSALHLGIEVIGIRRGWNGLINGDIVRLDEKSVAHIINRGGTILYTARSEGIHDARGTAEGREHLQAAWTGRYRRHRRRRNVPRRAGALQIRHLRGRPARDDRQ